jgi:hypothetical protein
MIPWRPSGDSMLIAIADERKRKPRANTAMKANIPIIPMSVWMREKPAKNFTPKRIPKTAMILAWMKDFVTPESATPAMMLLH